MALDVCPYCVARPSVYCIGTTDVPFSGRADDVAIDGDEIDYLLGVVRRYFIKAPSRAEVISAFSGVRPLFDDETDNASAVTRDYVFDLDATAGTAPLLSVFGGNLAEQALQRLAPFFPAVKPAWTERAALPGGDFKSADFAAFLDASRRCYPWLPVEVANGYARRYGTRMHKLLAGAASPEDLGRRFGGGLFEREARFRLLHPLWK